MPAYIHAVPVCMSLSRKVLWQNERCWHKGCAVNQTKTTAPGHALPFCGSGTRCHNPNTTPSQIMMTSRHGNAFRITALLWGESTGDQWFPLTKAPVMWNTKAPVMWNLNVFFDVSLNKLLNKKLHCRYFETSKQCLCDVTLMTKCLWL